MVYNNSQNIKDPIGSDLPETSFVDASKRVKDEYEYVVGIDFGTTYSGVAYARVEDQDHLGRPIVFDISKWPRHNTQVTNKIPTRSVYKNGELIKWGDQALNPRDREKVEILTMYKLLLSENSLYVDIPTLPLGFNITRVIADYLRELYNHTYKTLYKVKGKQMDQSKVRFCLTVPAVWTEKAKIIMRDAAIEADIINANDPQDRLLLVGEPEAAALYCSTMLKQYNLKHGDTFLICDAGGGTVDLVVYSVNDEPEGEKYLIEVAAGDGGLCGSVNLDQRFKKYVAKKIRYLTGFDLTEDELTEIAKEFIITHKENVTYPEDYKTKLHKRTVEEDDIAITLPFRLSHLENKTGFIYIADGRLNIPIRKIRRVIFDPVVNEVLELIQAQCNGVERLDAIFLVGGFGQSDYLIGKIQAMFGGDVGIIARPEFGQMAIVRGAVFMGLTPLFVKKRVIRRTYGYECALVYDEIADRGRPKAELDGTAYCNGRFIPYAIKGDVEGIDYSVSERFTAYYRNKTQSIRLFACDGDRDQLPRYTDDKRVEEIIKFDIIMPELPGVDPDDTVEIIVRFFLYQTEIKLEVKIAHSIKVYTGLYPRETGSISNLIGKLQVSDNASNIGIESRYEQYRRSPNCNHENELGIIGNIPETGP